MGGSLCVSVGLTGSEGGNWAVIAGLRRANSVTPVHCDACRAVESAHGAQRSVLVVVLAVNGVPAAVVDVIDVIAVRDRHVTAAVAVHMIVVLVHLVAAGRLAFVVVIVVLSVKVTVVHVVDMIAMRDRDMPAAVAVDVDVFHVLSVGLVGHGFHHHSASLCRPES